MLREYFTGRNPSHFHVNPIVRAYIVSESFLWSSWDFIIPIASVFVVSMIKGGNVQIAAAGYSLYLIFRVVTELIVGEFLAHANDRKKIFTAIVGIIFLSFSYIGFSITHEIILLFFFYALLGVGLGIASPAKNTLFAMHLDRNKEATEWGIMDAIVFICMALATALGGFIANQYGFALLFLIAAIMNIFSIVPYLLIINKL